MADVVHISSLIVRARPERLEQVKSAIASIDRAEIYRADRNGKIVVVLETRDQQEIAAFLRTIESLQGVLNASLVCHHVDEDIEEH